MNTSPIAWLERGYNKPRAFRVPANADVHTPSGMYHIEPDHPTDCQCETNKGEFWLHGDTAAKWRAS